MTISPTGAQPATSSSTVYDAISLDCPVFAVNLPVSLRFPIASTTGDLLVAIGGSEMNCNSTGMYVFVVPAAHGSSWQGRNQTCSVVEADPPASNTQRCEYQCTCPNTCAYLQVVHQSENVTPNDVKMCYTSMNW